MRKLKESDFNFPAELDHTNISVILDDAFFDAYYMNDSKATDVYSMVVRRMLKTGEPGFTVDVGQNAGEHLRNAPLSADTYILTKGGYKTIKDTLGSKVTVWTGIRWAETQFNLTKQNAEMVRVSLSGDRVIKAERDHEFLVYKYPGRLKKDKIPKIVRIKAGDLKPGDDLVVSLPTSDYEFSSYYYTLGFLFGDGSIKDGKADVTICSQSKMPCVEYFDKSLVTGDLYPDNRGYRRLYLKSSTFVSKDFIPGDIDVRYLPSFIAGLFDSDGSYDSKRNMVRLGLSYDLLVSVRRELERLGIISRVYRAGISAFGNKQCYLLAIDSMDITRFSEIIPTKRFRVSPYVPYRQTNIKVKSVNNIPSEDVYCCDVGYDEHSFTAEGVLVSNCCEVTSRDDSDICNLGSMNLGRIKDIEELEAVVELSTIFLLCGSLYSLVPYEEVKEVRNKNRRLGLGIMGLHEWMLQRDYPYGPNAELGRWLKVYATSGERANYYSEKLSISPPVKTRAIAPAGTISIIGELRPFMQ